MTLDQLRLEIDEIDRRLLALFADRMEVSARIAVHKQANALPVRDAGREEQKLAAIAAQSPPPLQDYTRRLWTLLFELSRDYQGSLSPTSPDASPLSGHNGEVER